MPDLLPVELVFSGCPFDEGVVRHTLRHLAMRVGWQLVPRSQYRLMYATGSPAELNAVARAAPEHVIVPSSPPVREYLRDARTPLPTAPAPDGHLLPFPQDPPAGCPPGPARGWVGGDVVAGAYACLNLSYEQHNQPAANNGWITYQQDWMVQVGLRDPLPLADRWLDRIYDTAQQLGWPATKPSRRCTIVLTHDVDYLPRSWDRGVPRLARALYRQLILRRRPRDAVRLIPRYMAAVARARPPYLEIPHVVAEEKRRGVRSSFHFVAAHQHHSDPGYARRAPCPELVPAEWEVCLHSSYLAARTPGWLGAERARLENLAERPVHGCRQHYLNFEPGSLFRETAQAGLRYDTSVGYNDRSGPRAGTYFPFRPCNLETGHPHPFWEIPFVLMDTTLATTYRFSAEEALAHAQAVLQPVIAAGGCVAIIWHQEQCGGLLDPGYDRVYFDLLEWLGSHGVQLTTGASVLPALDAAWEGTVGKESAPTEGRDAAAS